MRSPELGLTLKRERYTRWLANSHYENFHVVSFLLPKKLHQDFYNVYSFCRWADDLGDEIGDTAESLRLLAWWRTELDRMYSGEAQHPVFVALMGTVRKYDLPIEPFSDLIHAFVHDQTVTRYATGTMCCITASIRQIRLADCSCTCADIVTPNGSVSRMRPALRLQLANFWQDVSVDLKKDRVYIPQEAMTSAWLHGSRVV